MIKKMQGLCKGVFHVPLTLRTVKTSTFTLPMSFLPFCNRMKFSLVGLGKMLNEARSGPVLGVFLPIPDAVAGIKGATQ